MPQKVMIGFSKPRKWHLGSWLIMLIERTNCAHTFVSWKDDDIERTKVFEAVGSGVRIIGNALFQQRSKVTFLYSFTVSIDVVRWLEQYAHDQSGKPYGFKHIVGILIMRIIGFFGKKIANPFKDGAYSQICVEAGAYVIEKGLGVDLPGDIEDYGLKEYLAFCREHGKKEETNG